MAEENNNDWLEDFVRNNREDFDAHEPAPEVWERIELRKPRPKMLWTRYAAAAAVAALLALAWFKPWEGEPTEQLAEEPKQEAPAFNRDSMEIDPALPELIEAEAYYAVQLANKMEELRALPDWQPELEADLQYDLAELDSAYVDLKADLNEDLANEAIIEAMIQNYRLKLRVLQDILMHLQKPERTTEEHGTQDHLL